MNNEIIHAVLADFCSTDCCRLTLRHPIVRDGVAYASNGRVGIRIRGVDPSVGLDSKTVNGDKICDKIDEICDAARKNKSNHHDLNMIRLAAYLATTNRREYTVFGGDDEVLELIDPVSRAIVKLEGKYYQSQYIRKITDALTFLGADLREIPSWYMEEGILLVERGNVSICAIGLRDFISGFVNYDNYVITDAETGKFITKFSEDHEE